MFDKNSAKMYRVFDTEVFVATDESQLRDFLSTLLEIPRENMITLPIEELNEEQRKDLTVSMADDTVMTGEELFDRDSLTEGIELPYIFLSAVQ